MSNPNELLTAELAAGQAAVRAYYDQSPLGMGHLVTDEVCMQIAAAVVTAVDDVRSKAEGDKS